MNAIASSPPRLGTRAAVIYLFEQHGIRVAQSTMKTWASRGGGPEFQKSGPHRLYPVERLDVWVKHLTPVVASASELTSLLTTDT